MRQEVNGGGLKRREHAGVGVLGWMRQEVNGRGKVGGEEVKDVGVNGWRLKRREHAGGGGDSREVPT